MEASTRPISLDFGAPAFDPTGCARSLARLAAGLEARVPGTDGHARRVSRYAAGIARKMGLPREQVARVRRAGAIHDIGKFELPPAIVNKPGPLSDREFALVQRHAAAGERMVTGLGDEQLTAIVRHHHERLDGSGYPDRLGGEEIPLGARIVAVADTFDALTSARPYRPAGRDRDALVLLEAEAGTQLDPEVVRAFRDYYSGPRGIAARLLAR
jgi:putative two-component system response regulator